MNLVGAKGGVVCEEKDPGQGHWETFYQIHLREKMNLATRKERVECSSQGKVWMTGKGMPGWLEFREKGDT